MAAHSRSQPNRGGVLIVAAAAIIVGGVATHTHRAAPQPAPAAASTTRVVTMAPALVAPPADAVPAIVVDPFDAHVLPASFADRSLAPLPRAGKIREADRILGFNVADSIPRSLLADGKVRRFSLMIQVVEGRVILGGEVAREADRLLIAECAARVPNVVGVENQIELGMSSYTYLDARYCGESVADVHLASEVARALGKARVVAQSEIRIQPEFLRPFDLWLDPLYSIGERAADAEAGIGPFATLVSSGLAILVIEGHREVLWRIAEGLEPMLAEDFDRHETSYNSVVFTTGPDGFGPTIGPETDYLFEEAERFELMDSDLSLDELFEDASSSVDTFELPPRPRILVHVRDGLVTLTGSAESEAHRERAAAVAAKVPGVLRVESALTVQSQADYQELLDREIRKHLRMPEMPRPPHSADVDGGPREVRAASFVPIYSDDPDIRTRQLIFVSDGVVAFNPERIAHHSPGSRAERERTLG